ncbi:hypothetical protein P691DRAFT_772729, partial [Macrolepiota fuliginosa MF-IS2]
MSDVGYYSSARDPPPRYDEARTKLINMVERLLSDPDAKERLLLLLGPAGVGKSAIAQTLAERQAKNRTLGASLFFSQSTSAVSSSPPNGSPDQSSR